MAEYNDEIQRELEAIAMWHTGCSDYYRAPSGRIVTQWPRSMPALEQALSGLDEDAYEVAARSLGRLVGRVDVEDITDFMMTILANGEWVGKAPTVASQ